MPLRTAEDLQTFLQAERVWRRKEIGTAFSTAEKAPIGDREAMYRAFWLLQYAHWEGFVKAATENYLYYVADKKLNFSRLQLGFRLLPRTPLRSFVAKIYGNTPDQHDALVSLFSLGDSRFSKRHIDVSTEGNLRFSVLKKLSALTSVDLHSFVEESYLDKVLADRRNDIAHGRWMKIEHEDALELRDRCAAWMDAVLNNFVNAALLNSYLSGEEG